MEILKSRGKQAVGLEFKSWNLQAAVFKGYKFKVAGDMIWQITAGLWNLIVDAFKGRSPDVSNLTGPVGIVSLVGDASNLGIVYLLMFVALISINLVV
ncbi:MAG: site-2 protease family protein [Candidatus Paceibacterota bacterium]